MHVFPARAGCLVFLLAALPVSAATVPLRDLTPQQVAALDDSQERLGTFDRALQALDARRARHKISLRDYRFQEHELLAFIANEADFQNAILHKDRTDPFILSTSQSNAIEEGCGYVLVFLARAGLECLNGVSH